jgi:hypothetical protein
VRSGDSEFVLHRTKGDTCAIDSLQPLEQTLDPNATYAVENLDAPPIEKRTGKDLMETGLPVKIARSNTTAASAADKASRRPSGSNVVQSPAVLVRIALVTPLYSARQWCATMWVGTRSIVR